MAVLRRDKKRRQVASFTVRNSWGKPPSTGVSTTLQPAGDLCLWPLSGTLLGKSRNPRPERGTRPATSIIDSLLLDCHLQMAFVERDQDVQTLAVKAFAVVFTYRAYRGRPNRRSGGQSRTGGKSVVSPTTGGRRLQGCGNWPWSQRKSASCFRRKRISAAGKAGRTRSKTTKDSVRKQCATAPKINEPGMNTRDCASQNATGPNSGSDGVLMDDNGSYTQDNQLSQSES